MNIHFAPLQKSCYRRCAITAILILCLSSLTGFAHAKKEFWDEIVGKRVANFEGVTLGHVTDAAIDLEHGRCLGLLVKYGGVLGIGSKTVIVPLGAWSESGAPRTLYVNIDEAAFRNAPTFKMSTRESSPSAEQVAKVFQYFGQTPYFTAGSASATSEPLGYVQKSSRILYLPIKNPQGRTVGTVFGFHNLNAADAHIESVIVMPFAVDYAGVCKTIPPQALRYNSAHTHLLLADYREEFRSRPAFISSFDGSFWQ